MAQLNKNILGGVKGTLGNITFRQRNGKNFLCLRPESYKASTDPLSLLRKSKFRLAAKIAKTINSNIVLKAIWKAFTPNGFSVFNNIIKVNFPYLGNGILNSSISLVPVYGFKATKSAIDLNENRLLLTTNPIGTNNDIDPLNEVEISLYAFTYLNSPIEEGYDDTLFFLDSDTKPLELNNSISFTVNLNSNWNQLYPLYNNKKAVFVLVTKDVEGNPIRFSTTFI